MRSLRVWSRILPMLMCLFMVTSAVAPGRSQTGFSPEAAQSQIHQMVNSLRQQGGGAPLAEREALVRAARLHSEEMLKLNYFSHDSPTSGRRTTMERVRAEGVSPRALAENIFQCKGFKLEEIPDLAVQAWMESPGHRQNMLSGRYGAMGVGVAFDGRTCVVTQVFADR